MTLGYRTKWQIENMPIHMAGKPTYFVEKIWQSFPDEITTDVFSEYLEGLEAVKYDFNVNAVEMFPKNHTIRIDEKNLWKAGRDIHFVINNRTPQRFQFAPVLKCTSVQKIEITHSVSNPGVSRIKIDDKVFYEGLWYVFVNTPEYIKLSVLAINDGFETIPDFFAYFNKDFTGKLIHWTNLKY